MQKQKNQIWLYDIETLKSCFTYTAINIETSEIKQFVLHKDLFQLVDLIKHLRECEKQIGFNNESFDYPIIHYLLIAYKTISLNAYSREFVIDMLYREAQRIIEVNTYTTFSTTAINYKEVLIPQVDLFKMWHYNNAARSTSLKALEISMNYPNVMEMPISHTKEDITLQEVKEILNYNLNDVLATFEFYKKSNGKISLRNTLQREYGLYCMNWSDSKIGEKLILKLYSDLIQAKAYDISKLRTKRLEIALNDVILDYVGFNSKEFGDLLKILKKTVITETKDAFKHSVIYKGFKYEYGTGGIHGCIKPGIYTSNEDYIIIDADVTSLYPNLAIQNNLYPEHLGQEFITVYNQIINLRTKAKREGNSTLSDGFKLAANSVYG